jgi:hypothetical protein
MNAELWQFCGLDFVIAGTERTYQGQGHGSVEIARFEFDPGTVTLGSDSLWIAWRFSNPHSGPIISGEPILGHTEDMFAVVNGSTCDFFWFGGELYAGFNANIRCLGQPPGPGACCDLSVPGEPICRESFAVDCNDPLTRWAEGASCSDPEAFDPPCGTSACCRWWGRCDDLIEGDCGALGGAWYGGDLCDDPSFRCPDYSRCFLAGWTPSCCDLVCGIDDYCCYYHWDAVCESLAYELCCTADEVTWLDPPDRVVDARQPHALYDPNDLQGIDTIRTQAAAGDDPKCWALCETDVGEYGPNAINEVAATGDGTFTLTLERPVTPGAVTTVSYADDRSIATFTSHPGNADGDGETGPPDILALIDFLNGGTSLPWGIYSCDLDRDGECAPADILRLIDLLNGAGEFDSWDETPLPVDPGICP